MRGIAVIGGEGPEGERLKRLCADADIIAAADSGLAAAEAAGLAPDWIVGDMDSLDDPARLEKYPRERVRRFPADKDFTDTELAIALLRENGCDEIWLSGGGGGRTDHLLALYVLFGKENPPDRWFTAREEIRCLAEGSALRAALPPSSPVSVFPLGEGPWEAESSGLKWPLNGLAFTRGGISLSNAAEEGRFEIRSGKGRFLVVMGGGVFAGGERPGGNTGEPA